MEIANITNDEKEVQIYYAGATTAGYGHQKIEVRQFRVKIKRGQKPPTISFNSQLTLVMRL